MNHIAFKMKTKSFFCFFYFSLLLYAPTASYSQVLDYMDIHLKVTEKVADRQQPLSNTRLKISDYGEVTTDASGQYTFPYAIRKDVDPGILISIFSGEHKMLRPLDGSISVDTAREEMYIELLVVNMAEESEAFKKRINDLESRLSRLKAKNELTQRQLNEINNQLLDTIMYFEAVKKELEREIQDYQNLTEEQKKEIEAQQQQIADLEQKVDQLTYELEAALEERYMRKNEYFKNISSNLLGYLRKVKDLRDHLPYISTYFASGSFKNYERDINGYNEQYEKFDNNQLDYLEGVKHYWENRSLSGEVEDLFSFIAKGMHYDQVYKTTMDIMAEVSNQRPKKAQKAASEAYEDLSINLRKLEKDINNVLSALRKNL